MKTPRLLNLALVASLLSQISIPVFAAERRIPEGTRVPVRLMEALSSATVKEGSPVNFTVLEDVVVGGDVVIKQGTPVKGVVVEAAAKRRMGRAGKLAYSVTETASVDSKLIRLRAVQDQRGDSNVTATAVTTGAVAVFVPVAAPFFLLRKGQDVVIPEGTRVDTFVDGEHVVQIGGSAAAASASSGGGGSGSSALRVEDVLYLHGVGFGEEVILARIAASSGPFSVSTTELLTLKRAGLSDRVIAAMVNATK